MIFKGKKSSDDDTDLESAELIISLDHIILDLASDKELVARLEKLRS